MKTNLNIDTQGLREKILDLAMRGKLVEQDAGDEPASALLEKIKAEKAELVKEGKIKKSKKLPEITDDEKPFDIPDNWEWVRLGDVAQLNTGKTPSKKYVEYYGGSFPFIKPGNISNSRIDYNTEDTLTDLGISKAQKAQQNDILITCIGNLGRNFVVDRPVGFNQQINSVRSFCIDYMWLHYALLSDMFLVQMNNAASATTVTILNKNKLSDLCLPLPPLAEQKRIADKVSELFKQVDLIEKNVAEYQDLEQAMRSKLLDLAMHGKLVEQDPSDEPASELLKQIQSEKAQLVKEGKIKKSKKLPEITDDEKPFDIPDSWKWVRLGDVVTVAGGKRIPAGQKMTTENTGHVYIRVSDMKNGTIDTNNLMYISEDIFSLISKYIINTNDIYITVAGTIGKVGIIPKELNGANLTENADRLIFRDLNQMWLKCSLESIFIRRQIEGATTKVGQPKLAIRRIQYLILPLPPLAEQRRIADKVSEMFEQLDIINNNLVSAS